MLCRYERTIFKSDKGFCIFAYSTSDESVPKEARNRSYYHDDKIHFTAIGYHLIATDAVEVELDGTWENSKHGLQLSVSMCKEVVPRDQAGILAYLSSGIIKGIGPETAKAIVARFGDKTMEVLEKEPDKLLIKELDRDTLVTFVRRIEVGPKVLPDGTQKATHRNQPFQQSVRIFYKFIGELEGPPIQEFPAVTDL